MDLLYTNDLSIGYFSSFKKRSLVSKINVSAYTGSLISILGRNGSGKSTLMKSLLGLQPGLSGKIFLQGENLSFMSPSKKS